MRTHTVAKGTNVANQQQAAAQQPVVPQQPVAPMQATVTAPVVTAAQHGVAPQFVVQLQGLRNARLQACMVAAQQRYSAATSTVARKHYSAKVQHYSNAVLAAKQAAVLAVVQGIYAVNGMQPATQAVRAVPHTQKHAASTITNVCAAIRAYVHANPHATCAQVKAHFGSAANPATVQTQYRLAKGGKA